MGGEDTGSRDSLLSVYILGAGRCGRVLARAIQGSRHILHGLWNATESGAELSRRQFPSVRVDTGDWPSLDGVDVVWVTVPDRYIQTIAPMLRDVPVALHASGALQGDALRHPNGARHVGSAHPIQSFPPYAVGVEHLYDVRFGLEGDTRAVEMASELVDAMGAIPLQLRHPEHKALYHAACCIASNTLVALMERAVRLFQVSGATQQEALQALLPLVLGTIENISQSARPIDVLTGPLARRDIEVVRAHLDAIQAMLPNEASSYQATVEYIQSVLEPQEV